MRLDRDNALERGGWDPRFARLLAFTRRQTVAAALVDTNGDLSQIDLDHYLEQPSGHWAAGVSGSVRDTGSSQTSDAVAAWGPADVGTSVTLRYNGTAETIVVNESSGWWLYLAPRDLTAAEDETPIQI